MKQAISRRVGLVFFVLFAGGVLLSGCGGSGPTIEEKMPPKNTKQFTFMVFEEGKHVADVPKDLKETLKKRLNQLHGEYFKDGEKARKQLGDKNPKTMTIVYRVVKFDPGSWFLRKFTPNFLRLGRAKMEVEAEFREGNTTLGKALATSTVKSEGIAALLEYENHSAQIWQVLSNYFVENFYREFKKK